MRTSSRICGAALRRRKKERTRPDRRKLLEADAEEASLLDAYARVSSRTDEDDEAKPPLSTQVQNNIVNQPPRVKRVRVWGGVYDDDDDNNKHSCQRGAEFAVTRV